MRLFRRRLRSAAHLCAVRIGRLTTAIIVLILVGSSGDGGDWHVPGPRDETRLAVKSHDGKPLPELSDGTLPTIPSDLAPLPAPGWFELSFDRPLTAVEREGIQRSLNARPEIAAVTPIYVIDEVTVVALPELLLGFDSAIGKDSAERFLDRHGLQLLRWWPGVDAIALAAPRHQDDLEPLGERLSELRGVRWVEPNLLLPLRLHGAPNDPLFDEQWAWSNSGQTGGLAGADLRALSAWSLATDASSIRLGIIDEGIDLDHPEFTGRIAPGYDATDQPSPGGTPGRCLPDDAHGTACAGLAAAAGNNGIGGTGVCWDATIVPIRIGYSDHWSELAWQVDSINWALNNDIDVLSISWGGPVDAMSLRSAITSATTMGRGGLGMVILAAAGNSGGSIVFPARDPNTIAIGATSPCDERKSFTSCDNDPSWASNRGLELDLVAPGVLLTTTDNLGSAGETAGDFRSDFGGTSAATPIVAGAAALLLSLDPALTASDVRQLLHSAAVDQVGPAWEDVPGWDPSYGWGRLDLAQLLAFTLAPPPPTNVQLSADESSVEVSWQGANYQTVTIARDGIDLVTLLGGTDIWVDETPPLGAVDYSVRGAIGGIASPATTASTFVAPWNVDLIWAPPLASGPLDAGSALKVDLLATSIPSVIARDLRRIPDLNRFERIWATVGVAPFTHRISREESDRLVDYLTDGIGGAALTLEGGDTWAFDPPLPIHDLFSIDALDPGQGDLGVVRGLANPELDLFGEEWLYAGENQRIDRLAAIPPAVAILANDGPVYDTAIFHEGPDHRTIGLSFELGGLLNGTLTRAELLATFADRLAPARTEFLRGDVNGSGTVNLADGVALLTALFASGPISCLDAGDVNDDGSNNVADVVALLSFLFQAGSPPPAPFSHLGTDPTIVDPLDCQQYP